MISQPEAFLHWEFLLLTTAGCSAAMLPPSLLMHRHTDAIRRLNQPRLSEVISQSETFTNQNKEAVRL